ncbi:hypothetical protein JZ751_008818 [Albula glossodonta]|uniref:Biopterin-dependent aromatic amino acid hydroxylase family profile domain-containing protein n=1 Tax=Albula glossodonta TaxID=121402 RepID=A0A8T2NZR7_9TELE|nr:hypothetical protein JZ751_008818 [Albula glossodonta]
MKTEGGVQFTGRKRSLIEDARKERENGSPSPGASRCADNFVFEEKDGKVTLNILFSLSSEKKSGLSKTGKVFETFEANIHHIETRPGRRTKNCVVADLEYFIRCEVHSSDTDVLINSLKRVADDVRSITEDKVPWFPRKIGDLDKCNHLITKYDPDLDQDHPRGPFAKSGLHTR